MEFLLIILSILCASAIFISIFSKNIKSKTRVPTADGALPVVGHLHQFKKGEHLFKKLASMSEKYGPAFSLRMGSIDNLVVSSAEMARECFTTHDRIFCDRPKLTVTRLMCYNSAMFGFAPYSAYWREIRRIATLELLMSKRVDMLSPVRASQTETYLKELYNEWIDLGRPENGVLVDMKQFFFERMLGLAVRMVGGRSIILRDKRECNKMAKVMRDFSSYLGVFLFSDMIPMLGWIDRLAGQEKVIKRIAKELDDLMESWLEEHKQTRKTSGSEGRDFMGVMLTALEDFESEDYDSDTVNKATCLNMIFGASDTTATTLTWVLSLLLNNPDKLEKARDELDSHVPKHRRVQETDIKGLAYLQAVVKETLRLYPPAPIIGQRSALEDCTLSTGRVVPKGTLLMVNAWKIHRDPRFWPEPDEFRPERFLTTHKDVDARGHNYEFIPFGSGRRSCPGIALGLRTVHFALASLLHCYELSRVSVEEIDMSSEGLGLINVKATPLEVYVKPRLDAEVYGF